MGGSPLHSRIFSSSGNSGIKVIERQLPTIKGSDTESKDSIQERISSVNKKGKFSPEVVQKTMLLELALLLLM
jgi:hypothetical protein